MTAKFNKLAMALAALAMTVALNTWAFELPPCQKAYDQAVGLFQAAEFDDAERFLQDAIDLAPEPDSEGVGYVPYVYLAAARYERGDILGAQEALSTSERFGVAEQTVVGRQMLAYYAEDIRSGEPVAVPLQPQSSPAYAENKALTELESELIRSRVLKRCALSDEIAENRLPWYFHYLLGNEFYEAGDKSRALEAYQIGANLKQASSRDKRLYGMWFMDYLPYTKIALVNTELGDWQAARDALSVALEEGEFTEGAEGWDTYLEIERRIEDLSKG